MISVIIPTRNAEPFLPALLERLQEQVGLPEMEILVVDSSSEDATCAIARAAGVRVHEIAAAEFDHGATRTMAVRMSRGGIVVFLTQDALPVDKHSLAHLVRPLAEEEGVAAACGRQLPWPGASLFGAHLRRFNYGGRSEIRSLADRHRLGLKTVFISNSFAAYRKDALAEVDYFGGRHLFGEDACAVGRLLMKGYRVAYVAEARVFHSHDYSVAQEFRRYFDVGAFHARQRWLLREFGAIRGEGGRYVRSELRTIREQGRWDLLPSFLCRNLAKWTGYKLGLYHRLLPPAMVPRLSMNPAWWKKNDEQGS